VLQHFKETGVDVLYIPGGCTAIVQVMDVFVNAVFKSFVRKKHLSWRAAEIKVLLFFVVFYYACGSGKKRQVETIT